MCVKPLHTSAYVSVNAAIAGEDVGEQKADLIATLYDVGGIAGKSLHSILCIQHWDWLCSRSIPIPW